MQYKELSITAPRRVGKSTLIRQIIRKVPGEGVAADRLIYYAMDDPALLRSDVDHDRFFDKRAAFLHAPDTFSPVIRLGGLGKVIVA